MEHKFNKPYNFEGKDYESISFDLDALTGRDIAAAKKEFAATGNFSAVPAADSEFCALVLARACKQPKEFFDGLPAKDYCALTQQVTNFLLG